MRSSRRSRGHSTHADHWPNRQSASTPSTMHDGRSFGERPRRRGYSEPRASGSRSGPWLERAKTAEESGGSYARVATPVVDPTSGTLRPSGWGRGLGASAEPHHRQSGTRSQRGRAPLAATGRRGCGNLLALSRSRLAGIRRDVQFARGLTTHAASRLAADQTAMPEVNSLPPFTRRDAPGRMPGWSHIRP